jgi:hypothetical protein
VKHLLIFIALALIIVWIIARVTLAVTSIALHLLWIVAVVMAIIWVIGRISNRA